MITSYLGQVGLRVVTARHVVRSLGSREEKREIHTSTGTSTSLAETFGRSNPSDSLPVGLAFLAMQVQ